MGCATEVVVAALITRRGVGVSGSIPAGEIAALSSWRIFLKTFPPSVPCAPHPALLFPHIW